MGSWGPRTFEDDIACDWLEDLYDSDPIAFFKHCLDLRGQEELEFLACVGVLCTAELIHGLLSEPRDGIPEAALQWIDEHELLRPLLLSAVPDAVDGLARVLLPDSQMRIRFEDQDELLDAWIEQVQELRHRLQLQLV